VRGIREIAEKGGAKNADHTLNNVGAFIRWQERLAKAADEKVYYPELRDTVRRDKGQIERASESDIITQMQSTLFPE
jgi:hypothetical protein